MSARCAGNSETENGQEQGELRAAANKATMFQPVRGCERSEQTEEVQENRYAFSYLLFQLTLSISEHLQTPPCVGRWHGAAVTEGVLQNCLTYYYHDRYLLYQI